ncbi:MAG: hypothetical protein HY064_14030 [Bacteroidetes bacterium]|nr:hypothetical protein [Bacteroidota bacterium]
MRSRKISFSFFISCFFSLPSFLFLFFSCNTPAVHEKNNSDSAPTASFRTVNIHNEYSLEIPLHLISTNSLNADASLQFADNDSNEFVTVIDEEISVLDDTLRIYNTDHDRISNFTALHMSMMKAAVKINGNVKYSQQNIDNLPAQIAEFAADVPGIPLPIGYKIAFVAGKKKYYTITAWCLQEDEKRNAVEMLRMLHSFREK